MGRFRRAALTAALALGCLHGAGGVASATIWQPVGSNTTDEISAVEYQSDSRFWYATTNGKLAYRKADGTFAFGLSSPGKVFTDIAFQRAGGTGIAVGLDGVGYRSADGGVTWAPITYPTTIRNDDCFGDPDAGSSNLVDDVFSVSWASDAIVYLTGNRGNVLKSTNAGASFVEVNKKPSDDDGSACRTGPADDVITDSAFFTSDRGLFITQYFGELMLTTDGFASNLLQKAELVNNYQGRPRIAVDTANPNRLWAVDRCDCLSASTDAGETHKSQAAGQLPIPNRNSEQLQALHDVAYAGGTVLAAGTGGQILNSIDGETFYYQRAGAPNEAASWKAVDLADGANGAVGGANGALVITRAANTVPDVVKPTATIGGPGTATAGQPVTFTAHAADNAGGSGIDPNGFTWTVAGLPAQSGSSATFTFPSSGFYTVRLTYRDLAGNQGDPVTKTIQVSSPPVPPLPTFAFPASTRPPVEGGVIRRRGGFFVLRVRGRLKVPTGMTAAQACRGSIVLTVKKGRRLLTARTATLSSTCGYRKVIRIARRKVGRARRLTLTVRFGGNSKVGASSRSYRIRVRR